MTRCRRTPPTTTRQTQTVAQASGTDRRASADIRREEGRGDQAGAEGASGDEEIVGLAYAPRHEGAEPDEQYRVADENGEPEVHCVCTRMK